MHLERRAAKALVFDTGRHVCKSCRTNILRRHYAQAAAAAVEDSPSVSQQTPEPAESQSLREVYHVHSSVILSRPPQITRDLTPFEKAFYLYQRRLNERTALNFTRYFYFKKQTPADLDWKRKIKTRLTAARDIGNYKGFGDLAWNDELLVGAPESDTQHQVDALIADAEPPKVEESDGKVIAVAPDTKTIPSPMPRETKADKTGDVKSLNRALQRTLYLLVQNKDGRWRFPSDRITGRENLYRAAERILVQSGGLNMNTWIVGNAPVAHRIHELRDAQVEEETATRKIGEKTFFMKARIMAGQANLTENKLGLTDFKWLSKEEIQEHVHPSYFRSIRTSLADR